MTSADQLVDVGSIIGQTCVWTMQGVWRPRYRLVTEHDKLLVMRLERRNVFARKASFAWCGFSGYIEHEYVGPPPWLPLPFLARCTGEVMKDPAGNVVARRVPTPGWGSRTIDIEIGDCIYGLTEVWRKWRKYTVVFDEYGNIIEALGSKRQLTVLRYVEHVEMLLAFLWAWVAESPER